MMHPNDNTDEVNLVDADMHLAESLALSFFTDAPGLFEAVAAPNLRTVQAYTLLIRAVLAAPAHYQNDISWLDLEIAEAALRLMNSPSFRTRVFRSEKDYERGIAAVQRQIVELRILAHIGVAEVGTLTPDSRSDEPYLTRRRLRRV